jgi:hypothetical protein
VFPLNLDSGDGLTVCWSSHFLRCDREKRIGALSPRRGRRMYGICASATYRSSVRGLIPSKAAASLQLSSTSSLIRSIPCWSAAKDTLGRRTTFLSQVPILGSSPRLRQISVLVRRGTSRPSLKPAIKWFKALEGVKQLGSRLTQRIAGFNKLFGVPDGEFDPINRDASLIGHLKFDRWGSRLDVGFDSLNDLAHDLRPHRLSPTGGDVCSP